jgi:hypothetical protein
MHASQTGSREMFRRGASQIRQSEGKSAANKPRANKTVPEGTAFRKFVFQRCRGLAAWSKGTVERVMSPVLLKTSLPRPAPG